MNKEVNELKKLHEFYKTGRFSKLGMATALKVDRRTIQRWFQGKHPPIKEHRLKIKNLITELNQKS